MILCCSHIDNIGPSGPLDREKPDRFLYTSAIYFLAPKYFQWRTLLISLGTENRTNLLKKTAEK